MKKFLSGLLLGFTIFIVSCEKPSSVSKKTFQIAVFIPGVRAESPTYNMLAQGVERAVSKAQEEGIAVKLTIVEAGPNQAEWVLKMTALAAEKCYDVIISSNPSIPAIAESVLKKFPEQHFLLFDTFAVHNKNIKSCQYNQIQQAWLAGTMAALVSTSQMSHANKKHKIGLIAGQEYPAMINVILPAFVAGAHSVDSKIEVDFRVVGNWFDAAKGVELARAMVRSGVDVIMPIAGGANQGVLSAASEEHFYVAWFDSNGYALAPSFVIASSTMEQERLAYEQTLECIDGKCQFGQHEVYGIKDGYVRFIEDDPLYLQHIPSELREKQHKIVNAIIKAELVPHTGIKTRE